MLAAVSTTVFFFKLAFALADLLAGWLLWRRYGAPAALLYLWNPLVIYSFAGVGITTVSSFWPWCWAGWRGMPEDSAERCSGSAARWP
jgi:hypothetical protein